MSDSESLNTHRNEVAEEEPPKYGFGVRHVQSLLLFLTLSMGYVMRVDMSVAIIAMTDNSTWIDNVEIFTWSKKVQDVILSSFFWGYMVMQIPGGLLAQRYGSKVLLVTALLVNGIVTIVTPWASSIGGWKGVCACRTLQGLTQATMFPSLYNFISKWIPNSERSRLGNFIFTGTSIGTIVGMPLSSLLSSTRFGWPCIFYAIGSFGILIGLLLWLFGSSSPQSHKSITAEEKYYIETSLKTTKTKKALKTPWRSILTSVPVIAIAVTHIGLNWGFLTFLTEIPTYFKRALGINVKRSGLLSALPYIAMWLGSIVMSFISDFIVNRKICSTITARRIFNSISSWGPAIGLICLGFLPPGNEILAIALLTITVGCTSGMYMGYMMNHIDLSPNFAGTLLGITNCLANAIGILAPITVGYILEDDTDLKQWRIVFCLTASIYFLSNLFYITFIKTDRQTWNEPNASKISFVMKETKAPSEKKSMLEKDQA